MSPSYRIEIIAEGQHHLGHTTGNPDKDADNLMKMFLPALEKHGHKITFAAFHHGEATDILVGTPAQILPAPASTESPVLSEVQANVLSVLVKLDGLTKLVKNATKPTPEPKAPLPPKKNEGGAPDADKPGDDKPAQSSGNTESGASKETIADRSSAEETQA